MGSMPRSRLRKRGTSERNVSPTLTSSTWQACERTSACKAPAVMSWRGMKIPASRSEALARWKNLLQAEMPLYAKKNEIITERYSVGKVLVYAVSTYSNDCMYSELANQVYDANFFSHRATWTASLSSSGYKYYFSEISYFPLEWSISLESQEYCDHFPFIFIAFHIVTCA